MLVVRYGMMYSSRGDAEEVAAALLEHPDAPADVVYPISSLASGDFLLLPRMSNGSPVKHKVMKRWVYMQLKAHTVQGKSKQHSDIGKCHH
jgi:hypothetical protein